MESSTSAACNLARDEPHQQHEARGPLHLQTEQRTEEIIQLRTSPSTTTTITSGQNLSSQSQLYTQRNNNNTLEGKVDSHAERERMISVQKKKDFLKRFPHYPMPPSTGKFVTVSSLSPNTSFENTTSCASCVSLETFQQKKAARQSKTLPVGGMRNAPFSLASFSAGTVPLPGMAAQSLLGGKAPAAVGAGSNNRRISYAKTKKSHTRPSTSPPKNSKVRKRQNSQAASSKFLAALAQACRKRVREDEEQLKRLSQKRSDDGKTSSGGPPSQVTAGENTEEGPRKKSRVAQSSASLIGQQNSPSQQESGSVASCPLPFKRSMSTQRQNPESLGRQAHDLHYDRVGADAAAVVGSSQPDRQSLSPPVQEFEDSMIQMSSRKNTELVVVSFTAKWCSACRYMQPLIEKFQKGKAKQLYKDTVKFVSVDVEEELNDQDSSASTLSSVSHEIAKAWNVESLPSFCLWKNGRMVERLSGANPFQLFFAINQHAAKGGTPGDSTVSTTRANTPVLTGSTTFSF